MSRERCGTDEVLTDSIPSRSEVRTICKTLGYDSSQQAAYTVNHNDNSCSTYPASVLCYS